MSSRANKVLGLAAVAVAITGLVGFGVYEVARCCDRAERTAIANASTEGDAVATRSCAAHKGGLAAAFASLTGSKSSCAAHKGVATTNVELASADGDARSAGCSAHKKGGLSTALSGNYSCPHGKSASATLASAGDANCSLGSASACSDLGACSVNGDLASAKGKKLEAYYNEKAEDGVEIAGFKLPEFDAVDLNGNEVSSSDLIGRPTVLVLLSNHCGHSYKSLPILEEAAAEFESTGLRVVGLMVNSSPRKARSWFDPDEVGHEVWVTKDRSVADALKSHLVPTYVLIDAEGNVRGKLVGFKDKAAVTEGISPLIVMAKQEKQEKDS